MTLDEKCNTNLQTPYDEKLKKWIDYLGLDAIKKCLPFSKSELRVAYEKGDINFKTLPLWLWELGAGFRNDYHYPYVGSKLTKLYVDKGIDTFTCTEGVCILKKVALIVMQEEHNKN